MLDRHDCADGGSNAATAPLIFWVGRAPSVELLQFAPDVLDAIIEE